VKKIKNKSISKLSMVLSPHTVFTNLAPARFAQTLDGKFPMPSQSPRSRSDC